MGGRPKNRLGTTVRKQFKRRRKQVIALGANADRSVEVNVFRRFKRLWPVRRFVFGWVALMVLLIGCSLAQFEHLTAYYQRVQPVPGGIYTEGIVGSISNVNPIYATSDVDRSLSRLVFSGLLGYGSDGQLHGRLAQSYKVGDTGKIYTVTLKHNLTWQDGQPLTGEDVAFTFNTIKDPDARSPLLATWRNINITAPDDYTVVFKLPSALASFPVSLTTGIIPQHLLGNVTVTNLRSSDFNTVKPVGTGPFAWRGLQVNGNDASNTEEQVALVPFAHYTGGQPKLNEFIIRSYTSEDQLAKAFRSGQLSAAAGLNGAVQDAAKSTVNRSMLLNAGSYVFYKTSSGVLASAKVRQALNAAINPDTIINKLGYATRPVNSPLLTGQLAYDKKYVQHTNDLGTARALLAQEGWQPNVKGYLVKDGKPLRFTLVASDTPEFRRVTQQLRSQWQAVGVKVDLQLLSMQDYATALSGHEYDATLYGLSIGTDPDVYAYWDGSQADVRSNNRLNLSEWNNSAANASLEAGRSRLDPKLRTVKYASFLQAWQSDAPALGLYQPRYLYVTRGQLYGLTQHAINNGIDRFNGVQNWEIRTAKVTQ